MNSIEKLVAKLSPDGVEFKALHEVFDIKSGYTPSKKNSDYWTDGTIPWFRMEDIRKNGRVLSDSIQHITPSAVKRGVLFPANSIIMATTATIGEHALITVDSLANQQFTFLSKKVNRSIDLDMKFMFYYGYVLGEWCKKNTNVASFPSVDMKKFKKFKIPIPPLEIQQEIVNILDTFTELLVELEAELEARRLQYQYYRDELLNFSGAPSAIHRSLGLHSTDKVEFKALKDLGSTYGGLTGKNKSDFTDGNARYITYRNIANNISVNTTENEFVKVTEKEKQNRIELGDVLFTGSSETPNEVGMSSEVCSHPADPIFLNSFCFGFRFDDKDLFESGFLKYLFRSNHIRKQIIKCANGVTRFNISKNRFMKIFIPIPPLAIQREIVSILDKFEALINDLSVGLPAEIDARRQQYEYYRDKLLTFKEKV